MVNESCPDDDERAEAAFPAGSGSPSRRGAAPSQPGRTARMLTGERVAVAKLLTGE
jgi:hypothetical protein